MAKRVLVGGVHFFPSYRGERVHRCFLYVHWERLSRALERHVTICPEQCRATIVGKNYVFMLTATTGWFAAYDLAHGAGVIARFVFVRYVLYKAQAEKMNSQYHGASVNLFLPQSAIREKNTTRPYRLSARTPPSQGGKRGSIPRRVTLFKRYFEASFPDQMEWSEPCNTW